jgi:tRNA(adenine34) deaminase
MNDESMMQHALALAERAASLDEVPIGAVIFFEGEVVGEGINTKETTNDPTRHAEMNAIADASND